jgi:serine/threonine-protein kinase HipA
MTREYNEKRKSINISGAQEKYGLRLEKNALSLTRSGSTHILKPVPLERFDRINDLPANEHLTMQIARQIFGIRTAACGIIFFDDGSPAYITRRFDYKPDGIEKYVVEDFAALLAKTPEKSRDDFKYQASYLDIARMIKKHVAAAPAVLLEFLRLLIFNYLVGNGDAHLKNFSLMETEQGDYILSPAYDLICTRLHLHDNQLALYDGLYEDDYKEESYSTFGFYTGSSFTVFAEKAGVNPVLANSILKEIMQGVPKAMAMVQRSFLSDEGKKKYLEVIKNRQESLATA